MKICPPSLIVLALLAGLGLAPVVAAGDTPSWEEPLEQLDDPSYETRERATQRLLEADHLGPEQLQRMAEAASSPEQHHRLVRVARHHVLRNLRRSVYGTGMDHGSLGIFHREFIAGELPGRGPAIQVIATMPGFPAHTRLEPGDLIVSFNGQPLPEDISAQRFRQMIVQHQAGEQVELELIRDGERIETQVRLAAGTALREMYVAGQHADLLELAEPYRRQWEAVRTELASHLGPAEAVSRGED